MTVRRPPAYVGAALVGLALVLAPRALAQAPAVVLGPAEPVEARVWLDRGEEPILQRGERARIYYRTVLDAYVAIFQIDTDGSTRLVFPRSPSQDHYARGGRDYRVLFPGTQYWQVNEEPGVGYFFIVASPAPFDFSGFRFSPYRRAWDLRLVGDQVYRDPYVAMDDYVAALVPDWETASYALDFTAYHVGERYEYPRFLCYDCHGFRQYASWNPYYEACSSFRVVIYDDPYFYPARRYRSDRVVWTQPVAPGRPRFAFRERSGGEPAGPLIQARVTPPPNGVLPPAPRRNPANGAGGVAPAQPSEDRRPTNLGVIRGRPSEPAARGTTTTRGGTVTAPARSGERPSGVVAPGTGATETERRPAPAADPESPRLTPVESDERLRPVLRKRPSEEGETRDTPSRPAPVTPERRNEPAQPERRPATTTPSRRPSGSQPSQPAQPAPSGGRQAQPRRESGDPPAPPQNGGTTAPPRPAGESGGSGSSQAPVVRRTPEGRPAVRREP